MKNLLAMVGTNSEKSTNRQLLAYMQKHFKEKAQIELIEIKDLPLFDKPADQKLPASVLQLADKIEASDGVIISTPEYDHSIPAVLSNALAWLSYGIYPFIDKPVMITGASYGTLGSSRAQSHLRQMLNAPELKARTIPGADFLLGNSLQAFDSEGNLIDPDLVKQLEAIVTDFLAFIDIMKQVNTAHLSNVRLAEKFSWEPEE